MIQKLNKDNEQLRVKLAMMEAKEKDELEINHE